MNELLVHSARLITADAAGTMRDDPVGWVRIRDGIVVATGTGTGTIADRDGTNGGADEVLDARDIAGPGAIITPGLVDIHNHGGATYSFDGSVEEILLAADAHARHGVTRIVSSLVSASPAALQAQLGRITIAMHENPGILGAHLEGPFLDHGHRGAHDPAAVRPPTTSELSRLLATCVVKQVTLAPELDGGIDAIAQIVSAGAVAAIGHTDADATTTIRAIEAGATLLTHAFNAMPPLHHRAPGPVGVASTDDRMVLEIIADGHHVDPRVVGMAFATAPGRVALVSDAMAAAAASDGDYTLGTLNVRVADGLATLAGTEILAGSTLTLDRAVRNVVSWGIPLGTAIAAATSIPARAVGRRDLGRLGPGCPADFVIWDGDLIPRAVWRDGEFITPEHAPAHRTS